MMAELKKLAEKSKTKIIFHGWLDNNGEEYKNLLEQSVIFVLMSKMESFGMVIVEAMCAGCAIITTKASGCAQIVENNGILVNTEDSINLKININKLISDKNELRQFQIASLKNVKKYNWGIVIKGYIVNIL